MTAKDDPIVFHPGVLEDLERITEEDPVAGEGIRDLFSQIRQAHVEWKAGKYKTFEAAIEGMSGGKIKITEIDDTDVPDFDDEEE